MKKFRNLLVTTFMGILLTSCGGVKITVQNVGDKPLKNVVVRTQSNTYKLGSISPGDKVSKRVIPVKDTDLAISSLANPNWSRIDTYLTRGYTGKLKIEINDDHIVKVTDDVNIP